MKERIKQLLINGMKASEIAQVVGCAPGYITQLCKDTDFQLVVQAGLIEAQEKNTEEEHLDARYSTLEHKLLSSANDALAGASLPEIMHAIAVVNKRADSKHARKHPTPVNPTIQVNVVSLALPAHATQQRAAITLNEKQEIIEIGGRALAPMSSDAVKALFASRMPVPVLEDNNIVEQL